MYAPDPPRAGETWPDYLIRVARSKAAQVACRTMAEIEEAAREAWQARSTGEDETPPGARAAP